MTTFPEAQRVFVTVAGSRVRLVPYDFVADRGPRLLAFLLITQILALDRVKEMVAIINRF